VQVGVGKPADLPDKPPIESAMSAETALYPACYSDELELVE
jgi:hypothetical protein